MWLPVSECPADRNGLTLLVVIQCLTLSGVYEIVYYLFINESAVILLEG